MNAEEKLEALKQFLQWAIDDQGGFHNTPHIYVDVEDILRILNDDAE